MLKFKVGDRVVYHKLGHLDYGKHGFITAIEPVSDYDYPKLYVHFYNGINFVDYADQFNLWNIYDFKIGSRVVMKERGSKYTFAEGTLKEFVYPVHDNEETHIKVHFDDNEPDHIVTFPLKYFELKKEENTIQQQRNNEVVKYAEWFKYAIRNINAAGGNPMIFIDKLPPDVIDSMVRNNLFIFYRGKDV